MSKAFFLNDVDVGCRLCGLYLYDIWGGDGDGIYSSDKGDDAGKNGMLPGMETTP